MDLTLKIIFSILSLIGLYISYKLNKKGKRNDDQADSNVKASLKDAQETIKRQKDTIENLTAMLSDTDKSVDYDNIQKLNDNFNKERRGLENKISELESQLSSYSNVGDNGGNNVNASSAKKFQLEIKRLKQDLEDAQDDIDDLKSKFKKEKAQLEGVIAEKQSESQKLQTTNEQLQEANIDLQNTIKNKNTSLEFVQEILTAQSADKEETVRNHNKAIEDVYNFIDGELYSCLKNLKDYTWHTGFEEMFGTDLKHWALNEKKTWIKGKTTIALIGEFSSGKTSIVNRLLSQDKPNVPLLPVSTKATTAIPTYISGGATTSYRYYSPENQLRSITEHTFTKVNKEVLDEIKGASQLIKYFVMTYNNPMLNGLSVLDTPGFLSNDKEDTERTIEVINECDALFWVLDVNKPVGQESLRLIKENLTKPLFVIINKIDTKSTTEVNNSENYLRQTFTKAGVPVQGFIRFSQKTPLSILSQPLHTIKNQQQRNNYLDELLDLVLLLEEYYASKSKNARSRYNSLKKDLDQQYAIYQRSFRNNSVNAQYAASIPRWEKPIFFGAGRYEMSKQDGQRLINLLKNISEDTEDTYQKFPGLIDATKSAQKEFEELCSIESNHRQIKKCLEKLRGLINKLN
ncbi:MAG: dynamin family protein [Bacteroidales bacterium]|nr:dynamin family protein [Bacteroidales bacterium]